MTTPDWKKAPRGKLRPWVQLYTTFLGDTDLILAGQNARNLYPLLLLHSAEQGMDGFVPADPRRVQLFAHFDDGVPAVSAALDALVACAKLEAVADDPALLYIRTWADYQADLGGSTTRSSSMKIASLRRYHAAGKHAVPRTECPLCNVTEAGPGTAAQPPAKDRHADPGTARRVEEFRSCFSQVFAAMDRLPAYRFLLAQADELAAADGGVSVDLREELRDAVLADALGYYLGGAVASESYPAASRAARALSSEDGHYWWLLAAQRSAGVEFNQPTKVISYLTKVAAGLRSDSLNGAAA